MISMKAQSLLTKPIILVLFIVSVIILINSMNSAIGEARLRERETLLRNVATNTILLLVNSNDCLAYQQGSVEYSNIIDVEKLDRFSQLYGNTEPMCARNFGYGWRANIIEINKEGKEAKKWGFGSSAFSFGKALRQGVIINSPVGIRYSDYDIRPGKIELKFIDGELEDLAGFIDKACTSGGHSAGKDIFISSKVAANERSLCMEKQCRELLCPTKFVLNPGRYYLIAAYKNGRVEIIK